MDLAWCCAITDITALICDLSIMVWCDVITQPISMPGVGCTLQASPQVRSYSVDLFVLSVCSTRMSTPYFLACTQMRNVVLIAGLIMQKIRAGGAAMGVT